MPDIVQCPHCPRKLQVPVEVVGQQVQCPSCGQTFTAGATTAPLPPVQAAPATTAGALPAPRVRLDPLPPPSEEAPWVERAPEEGLGEVEDWRKVRSGVVLVYYGLAALVLTVIVVASGGGCIAFSGGNSRDAAVFGLLVGMFVLLGIFANFVLTLIGQIFCLWAPAEHSARGLAIIALVLTVAGPGLTLTGGVVSVIESALRISSALRGPGPGFALDAPGVGTLLSNIGNVLSIFQMLAFLSFLRATALCMQDGELALSVQPLLALAGILAALFISILFLGAAGGGLTRALEKLGVPVFGFFGIAGLLSVIYILWYGRLLSQMRAALVNYILRRAGEG